jgi:hypothetical protein
LLHKVLGIVVLKYNTCNYGYFEKKLKKKK